MKSTLLRIITLSILLTTLLFSGPVGHVKDGHAQTGTEWSVPINHLEFRRFQGSFGNGYITDGWYTKSNNSMIGIIDYGLGNVRAFANVYKNLNFPAILVKHPRELRNVSKIILPGVGAIDYAMLKLETSGIRPYLEESVLGLKVPVLGICVGMQILARSSDEGTRPGLGWIGGEVKKFDFSSSQHLMTVPHMGWNNVTPLNMNSLFDCLDHESRFYFLHSYYFDCKNSSDIIAVTDSGGQFTSAVHSGNIFGVQFHPEKSHKWGIQLLHNFAIL